MAKRSSDTQRRLEVIDQELARLVQERLELAARSSAAQVEGQRLDELDTQIDDPLAARVVRSVLRELYSGVRAALRTTRVAFLGPLHSYSHLATVECFGTAAELIPVPTIAAVFEELHRGHVEFGVTPIENSRDGRVVDTLDMFARMPVRICGEVQLRIHHNLLARCGRADIREVYSKPQALSQCRDWLAKHLEHATIHESTSTAQAAAWAAERPGVAAIASRQAGVHYGLDVVAAQIEDNPHNVTRFAVLGQQETEPSGRDKTSIMFEIPHRPGALFEVLAILQQNALNLTWIESFPMPQTPNEYRFFLEFEGHERDEAAAKALRELRPKTVKLELLGSYPRSQPLD